LAWNSYAAALHIVGRYDEALTARDQVVNLDSSHAYAHNNRGITLRNLGRYDEALTAHDQAINLDPSYARAYRSRGITLRDLGRYDEALTAHDQAINLDPSFANAHNSRGLVLQTLGRSEDALAAYDRVIALQPELGYPHENKGVALAIIGEFDRALAEFEAANRLDPTGAGEGKAWAGAVLWRLREPARAREFFAQVEGRITGCTPFYSAEMEAVALCGLGQPDRAEQRLLDAVHRWVPVDRLDSRGLYDLLSDPPLPGVDRLRAIAERAGGPSGG
jgi:tetratricopeptide (TPR) repeat protein